MEQNELYPIFLKTQQLEILIVGGGFVALEKLTFLLKSSPNSKVTMVSTFFREETKVLANKFGIKMIITKYDSSFLKNKHMVIATTDNVAVNVQVYTDCKQKNIL